MRLPGHQRQSRDRRPGPWDEPRKEATRYGLSTDDVAAMVRAQSGRCLVCARALREPQVDHDHELARLHGHPEGRGCPLCVRGLLCRQCNSMLGFARDDPDTLRSAADYIEEARARAGLEV